MEKIGRSELLSGLFDQKTVAILEKLLLKKGIFYLREIAKESGVSLATTYRIVQKLKDLGLVTKEHQGKIIFYKIIRDSQVFNEVYTLIIGKPLDPVELLKKELNNLSPDFKLVAQKDKLFVVGKIEQKIVDELANKVAEQTEKKLNVLVLSTQQFEQMGKMGLISKIETLINVPSK